MNIHEQTIRQWLYELWTYRFKRKPLPKEVKEWVNKESERKGKLVYAKFKQKAEEDAAYKLYRKTKKKSCANKRILQKVVRKKSRA